MKSRLIIYIMAACSLSGCHIYKAYERPDIPVDNLYREPDTGQADTACFGNLSWREVFTDSKLQQLIERGLANNTDLQIAHLRIKEAEAALLSSRLSYLPGLNLAPQGTVSGFSHSATTAPTSFPLRQAGKLTCSAAC